MTQSTNIDIEAIWTELSKGIRDVYDHRAMTSQRFMELYTHVYNYCTRNTAEPSLPVSNSRGSGKNTRSGLRRRGTAVPADTASSGSGFIGHDLYNRIKTFLKLYLQELIEKGTDKNGEDQLTFYHTQWEHYTFSSKVVNGFCQYLNRHWVRRECDEGRDHVYQIYQLALDTWKETVFELLNKPVTTMILKLVEKDRNGDKVNNGLIKGVIASYVELGVDEESTSTAGSIAVRPGAELGTYQNKFENQFLEDTKAYYTTESSIFIRNNSVVDYMRKAEQRINEEQRRVDIYLHDSTLLRLMKTCDTVLIDNHLDSLHAEFPKLLESENQKKEDLGRMYLLVARLDNALKTMEELLQKHITVEGVDTIRALGDQALLDAKQYVSTILKVHSKYSELVTSAFKANPGFAAALDKACGGFINNNYATQTAHTPQKSPEIVARFCDQILRKSSRNQDDQELEDSLNQVMIVFKFLEDKDVFQKFYSKMLANRLVQQLSTSDDAESSMIAKLKMACGFEYTAKLQRMYQDIGVSKDLNDDFKCWWSKKQENEKLTIDFQIQVLSSGSWPYSQSQEFLLPREFEHCVESFNAFYNEKHNGRKLTWLYNRSRGELVTNGYRNRYVFQASTFQMGVLLLFNNADQYRISELVAASKLQLDIMIQIIQVLMKVRLVVCPVSCDKLTEDTMVSIYQEYKNKKLRVNINMPLKQEQKIEQELTLASVEEERLFVIQACIVRIMKMRKTALHQQLISEIITLLSNRFKPNIAMIKKAIDILIEKEYLKREEDKKDSYCYVA